MRIFAQAGQHLELRNIGSLASVVLSASAYVLGKNGKVQALTIDNVTAQSDRTLSSPVVSNSRTQFDGEVVMAQVRVVSGNPKRGEVFAILAIREAGQELCRGYVWDTGGPNLGFFEDSLSGRGFIRTITGTDPAAGAEILETVPVNTLWRLISFSSVLVSDATVANRHQRHLIMDNGVVTDRSYIFHDPINVRQAANQTRTHIWMQGLGNDTGDGNLSFGDTQTVDVQLNLHDTIFLKGGHRIRTETDALQAGDDYEAPIFFVEEWLDP